MYSGKKITKEDTWREEDLMRYMRGHDDESSRRREQSKLDEKNRTRRDSAKQREVDYGRGGARDEQNENVKERERDRYKDREREKGGEREKYKDRERHRESNGDKGRERHKERERERGGEKERERHRDKDRDRDNERERHKESDKDRERAKDSKRHKERDQERDGEKKRERPKETDRHKERNREKERERHEERDRERDGEKERERHKERDREKERERHKVRDRERSGEKEREKLKEDERARRQESGRRKEKEPSGVMEVQHRVSTKEQERRHREKEHGQERAEERRKRDKREKETYRESYEPNERDERRETKGKKKEYNEPGETQEAEHRHNRLKESFRESRPDDLKISSDQKHRRSEQEAPIKKSSWRSSKAELSDPEIPAENEVNEEAEDYGNEDYEDDFEDYEEDFEELDDDEQEEEEEPRVRDLSPRRKQEIEAIQRAMEKENELVRESQLRASTKESEPVQRVTSSKGRSYSRMIDFSAARQREISQHAAEQLKKRSSELLRLIELDLSVTETLLDLAPVSEYDLYIKSFGSANTKQVYVQCNEDNTEQETQTEDTETTDKWTQHPADTSVVCGGPRISKNASDEPLSRMSVDSKRLTAFLRSASQVMAVLLEENVSESSSVIKVQSQAQMHSFSDGCVQLNTAMQLLHGRRVTLLNFSHTQPHTLLSIHAPRSRGEETLDKKTIICVWNIREPSVPQRTLVYEAEVQSCCFSPGKATLVFAGTSVGSVVLWDLREPSGAHWTFRVGGDEWTLRYPTFSTDAVLSGVGHFSSVVSLEPVLVSVGPGITDPLLPDQEESLGLSFQLGSMDESGLLNLWVVAELTKADDSGSQTDLGLRPGGRVKLLHSSSIQTAPPFERGVTGVTSHQSFVLRFLPSDSNQFFIGSDMGLVRHGTRHGLRAVPKLYRPKHGERAVEVTALEFCPSGEPFFLVGCSDGSVRLHSLLREEPVCEWTVGSGGLSVQGVQLNPTRPATFYVLDSASVLHVWDLTEREDSPVITEDLHTDPVMAMAAFGDAAKRSPYSGIALAKASGRLQIHYLIPSLTLPQSSDTEKLHSLAQEAL